VGAILPYFSLEAALACQFEDDALTISSFLLHFTGATPRRVQKKCQEVSNINNFQ
jgi:hypothetical protein